MNHLTIGFSRPKKWGAYAALIMWAYGTPYSHVYIKFKSNTYDRDIIYQASQTTVNFMGTKIFSLKNEVVEEFSLEISDVNYKSLMQFCIDNSGKPYGFKQAVGLAIVRTLDFFGKKIKNPLGDKDHTYICSELAGFVLKEYVKIDLEENQDDYTPREIYEAISKINSSH